MTHFITHGVCSNSIDFELENGIVTKCKINGGCPGNTAAVSKLVIGMKATDVIKLLKGTPCRGASSCPNELARALEEELQKGQIVNP